NEANMLSFVRAIDRGWFFLVGRNDNLKSVVSANNVASAVIHLLPRMKAGLELFNLVDERVYSVRDLATLIDRALDVDLKERSLPLPLARVLAVFGDLVVKLTGRNFALTSARLGSLVETT